MDDVRFNAIAERGLALLHAAFNNYAGTASRVIAYNAFWRDQEVVVVGYRFDEDGHSYTRPLAVLMDEGIFDQLSVDSESGRVDGAGNERPPLVH
jgi:hypothetical protein